MKDEIISTNPSRGFEVIGVVAQSTREEVVHSIEKARASVSLWRETSIEERCRILDRYTAWLEKNAGSIAELQSQEMGKPIRESHSEVSSSIQFLKNQTEKAKDLLSEERLDTYTTHRTVLRKEPFGVAAVITPWNFPTSQFVGGFSQLVLAGNCVVLKHSEECVLTSQFLASSIKEAGFPDGVFQVLYGAGEVGRQLLEQDVDFIHFTGSSPVGKEVYKTAAEKFIPVTLEMGGSSPAVVMGDVDPKHVARSIYFERFKNCGQICCALKRLYVEKPIFDQVLDELTALVSSQVIGDALEETTTMGPLCAERQLTLLEDQLNRAKSAGAKVVCGGKRPPSLNGAFFEPTIVIDCDPDSPLIREETFGPILPIVPFHSKEEALALANDTRFGLSAFIYTNSQETAEYFTNHLQAGQVSVNGASYFSNHAPFGGYKESGIGRVRGDEGLREATQLKVVGLPVEK